jgi:hypothetical protein
MAILSRGASHFFNERKDLLVGKKDGVDLS